MKKIIDNIVQSRKKTLLSILTLVAFIFILNKLSDIIYSSFIGYNNHSDTLSLSVIIASILWFCLFFTLNYFIGLILYKRAELIKKSLKIVIIPSLIFVYTTLMLSYFIATEITGFFFLTTSLIFIILSLYIIFKKID